MEPEAYEEIYRLEDEHWWYRGMREIVNRVLSNILTDHSALRILDAGCGVGGNLSTLARFGSVLGIDYSPLALNYANTAHPGDLVQASVEKLPYADHSFDLVTSFDVLYCREVNDDVLALAEFARVLRPGGYTLVRLPALPILRGSHDVVVHGIRRYTAAELREKMALAGLHPIRWTYLNSLLLPLVYLIRCIQNLRIHTGDRLQSDVRATPEWINAILTNILRLEASWIDKNRHFPAGVSVMCLAQKPEVNS